MNEEKIIYPEDVVLELADVPIYKVNTKPGVYYTENRQHARQVMATHRHCTNLACDRPAQPGLIYCQECEYLKRLADRAKSPVWDGKFPIFVEDHFIFDEEELIRHLRRENLVVRDIFIYHADPVYAKSIEASYEDYLGEGETELPSPVQEIVDEFHKKLAEIKEPFCWFQDKMGQFSEEQMVYYEAKVSQLGSEEGGLCN